MHPSRTQCLWRALWLLIGTALMPHAAASPGDTAADEAQAVALAAQLSERQLAPPLQWQPCAENQALECGWLRVPIDYRKPWAGALDLAVIRAKATQPDRRIGVLFGNPGGPGGSGVDFVLFGTQAPAFRRLRERFDIVSFDVRGSHRSQAASCVVPRPEGSDVAAIDAFSRNVARICIDRNGPLVTSMSTNNIALDLDVLRRAMGEGQLSFTGLSFGTVLGSVYASVFPQRVRALLLDAGVLPNFRDGGVEHRGEQDLSFEMVFQRLDQLCRAAPTCRLQAAGVSNTLREVKARLAGAPVQGPGGALLTAESAGFVLTQALARESQWPLIVDAVADAQAGNYAVMFALLGLTQDGGVPAKTRTLQARQLIRCNDYGTRRSAAEVQPVSDAISAVSDRLVVRSAVSGEVATCAAWPEADVPIIRNLKASGVPVLLLGAHFDPTTPLSWTRTLAMALGAERRIVRYRGGGHGSYAAAGITCIDQVGDSFLFDLKVPEEGFSCAARPIVFRPAAGVTTEDEARRQVRSLRDAAPAATMGF